jgi:hypothetical protein
MKLSDKSGLVLKLGSDESFYTESVDAGLRCD